MNAASDRDNQPAAACKAQAADRTVEMPAGAASIVEIERMNIAGRNIDPEQPIVPLVPERRFGKPEMIIANPSHLGGICHRLPFDSRCDTAHSNRTRIA